MNNSFFNVLLTRSATALSFGLPHSVMLGMIPSSFLYLVDYIVPYSYCKLAIIFSIPNSTCQSSILFLVRIYILRLKKVHSDFLRNTPYYIYTTKRSYSQLYRRITNLENLPELALMTKMPAGKEAKSKCASPPWKLAEATFAPEAV